VFWRGVRGTTVCVDVVDRDEEEDADDAGEATRGGEGDGLASVGVGVRGGDGG